jgi:flagellar biosynthesis/type III secretory pathway M-ring protein FliF/YscJ
MIADPEKPIQTSRVEALVETLREGIAQDPALAASVLRTWLDEKRT